MNEIFWTTVVFGVLFAPFVILLLLLRFVPQARRRKMVPSNIPGWRNLPSAARGWTLVGAMTAAMTWIADGRLYAANTWLHLLGWPIALFCLGVAFGHWQAAAAPKVDRS